MSSADLWEDDYPHGTVEGFDGGCRGGACPAADVDMPCKRAKTLAAGDIRYNRLVAAGKTPAEIAAVIDGHEPEHEEPAPAPKPKAPRQKRVAAAPVEEIAAEPKTSAEVSIAGLPPTATTSAGPNEDEPPLTDPATEPSAAEPDPQTQTVDAHEAAKPQPDTETPTTAPDPEPPAPDEETTVPLEPFTPLTTDKWTAGLNPGARTFVLRSIREWARTHGFAGIPNRGRIPQAALAAFDEAHPDGLVPEPPAQSSSFGIDAHVAELREVRVWARGNGWPDLGDRGLVDDEIREAYNAAHAAPVALEDQAHPVVPEPEPEPVPDAASIVAEVTAGVVSGDEWDAVRERAGLPPRDQSATVEYPPLASDSRPIWGDVAVSEDVERARNIAVLLEGQNALLLEQLGAAHTITESCITHNRDLRGQLEEARKDAFQQKTVLRIAESSNQLLKTHIDNLAKQVKDLKADLVEANKPWWKRIL